MRVSGSVLRQNAQCMPEYPHPLRAHSHSRAAGSDPPPYRTPAVDLTASVLVQKPLGFHLLSGFGLGLAFGRSLACSTAARPSPPGTRGLHSSTFQLNLSCFWNRNSPCTPPNTG
jgi:hypothetical protein